MFFFLKVITRKLYKPPLKISFNQCIFLANKIMVEDFAFFKNAVDKRLRCVRETLSHDYKKKTFNKVLSVCIVLR